MIITQVKDSIRQYDLIRKKDTVVAAVSGGPDSMALLYLLCELREEFGFKLVVAHLDHRLRSGSKADLVYVRKQAQKLKIPFIAGEADVKVLARRGSLEEAARNARIEFLCGAARAVKATKIALGHSLDDQAETVLMRLLRGTGLYGLQAIIPKRRIRGYEFIRPLIAVSRRQIRAYVRARKIKPRIDRSNFSDAYLRNRIRRHLLPILEKKYNTGIRAILAQTALTAGTDYDYLDQAVRLRMRRWGMRIPLQQFLRMHPALQRLVVRRSYERASGSLRVLAFRHMREIMDLAFARPARSVVDLPKGVSAVKSKTHLKFYRR